MEVLDEFDNEYPLTISFCKMISLEDFEEQSLSYTQQCLCELYSNMEQNPRICERALRKQKQMENEETGLISYLKAKIFQALQGELNYSNCMSIAEMKEKVLQLRQEMQRANNYARAAKTGKGQHPRKSQGKKHTLEGRLSCLHSEVPEPPRFTMPRVFGPFPEVMNKQVDRAMTSSPNLKYWWTGLTTVSQKSMANLHPIVLSPGGITPSRLVTTSVSRERRTSQDRLLGNAPTTSQNAGSTGTKPAASVFNTPMSCKFQGDAEDDTDSEKPSLGSSAKEA